MQPVGRTVSVTDELTSGRHLFVVSTAAGGTLSDRNAPALHGDLVEQVVTGLTRQYPGSPVQLVGPDPGGAFRRRYPDAFKLQDNRPGWAELGAAGATVIGTSPDIEALRSVDGLRTLWLDHVNRGAVPADGPVASGRAQTQRFDLPPDWAARRDEVDAGVRGLPDSRAALLATLRSWDDSATAYHLRTSQRDLYDARQFGLVDPVLELRHTAAERVATRLYEGRRVLTSDPGRFRDWWTAARQGTDADLRTLARLTSEEMFGLLRRAPDGMLAYGAPVQAESIKGVERDPRVEESLARPDTVGADLRMNPALMRLTDLTAEHFTLRPGATWQFIVTPGHALPRLGSETASKLLLPEDWAQFEAARAAGRPERILRSGQDLRQGISRQIDGLGHPTVGGHFGAAQRFLSDHLQVGGEVRYDAGYKVLIFNDMSGRSMSPKVRDTAPAEFREWVSNVARMVSAQTGLDWEIGLSKQGAKGALKANPNDMVALAEVAVVKAGLSDRGAVTRLRDEVAARAAQVGAGLAAAPDSAAKTRAVEVWGALGAELETASRSQVNAAARAIAAYSETVTAVTAALGPESTRVLRDPAGVFPLPVSEPRPGSLFVGSRDPGGDAARAADGPGVPGAVEVRYRDNPDAGDFAMLRAGLLSRPVDEVRAMVYRPSAADLSADDPKKPGQRKSDDALFDGRKWADQAQIPVAVLASQLPPGAAPPPGAVEHLAGEQRYFRFEPASHLVRQHLDHQVAAGPASRRPAAPEWTVATAANLRNPGAPVSTGPRPPSADATDRVAFAAGSAPRRPRSR